jgi:hypothetical protein
MPTFFHAATFAYFAVLMFCAPYTRVAAANGRAMAPVFRLIIFRHFSSPAAAFSPPRPTFSALQRLFLHFITFTPKIRHFRHFATPIAIIFDVAIFSLLFFADFYYY